MLNKELLLELNRERNYEKIYEIFAEEYKLTLEKFLEKKHVKIIPGATLVQLIYHLSLVDGGKYSYISDYLTDIFFDDSSTLSDSVILAIDKYNSIISEFGI